MKLAFDRVDLLPLRLQLIDRYIFEPADAAALMDLAVLEQVFGNLEAGLACQAEALSLCRVYSSPSSRECPGLRLLAFAAPGDIGANIPLELLLDGSDVQLHTLYIVPGLPLPAELPEHDVAIVAAGQADERRAVLDEIAGLFRNWPSPVLNRPDLVPLLSRERLPQLLSGMPGLVMPSASRRDRTGLNRLRGHSAEAECAFPLVVRPVDSHAGKGLARLDGPADIPAYLKQRGESEFHLSPYVDYRSSDGLYRKYRIAFIDGVPYPVHMAISDQWKIWYVNAGMDRSPEKRAEEAEFLTQFDRGFGRRQRAALAEMAGRIRLDYFGIDCAETRDGDLLIFEADIAQVVHDLDPPDLFPYKRPAMRRLFAAFRDMLGRRRKPSPP